MDLRLFRTDPDVIRESQRRRFRPVEEVDDIIKLDEDWRARTILVSSHECGGCSGPWEGH